MGRGDYHRWNAKGTTNDYYSISLAAIKRHGCMKPKRGYWWSWSRRGERIASINFDVTDDSITFRYSTKDRQGKPLDVNQVVYLTKTVPNYGGERKWFLCGCGRRVARLFINHQHVACRHCFKLAYPSQNDGCPINRMWRKIHKLEARLKDDRHRPKGMHHKTFARLKWELAGTHMRKDEIFIRESMRRFPGMF